MTLLRMLEPEFHTQWEIFDDFDRAAPDRAAALRRVEELTDVINAAPPESLRDCVLKLRILADGIAMTERNNDRISLRQVIAFLERGSLNPPHASSLKSSSSVSGQVGASNGNGCWPSMCGKEAGVSAGRCSRTPSCARFRRPRSRDSRPSSSRPRIRPPSSSTP